MLKISGLHLDLGFTGTDLRRAAAKKLRVPESALGQVRLAKKSVDARKKDKVHFVCAAEVQVEKEARVLAKCRDSAVQKAVPYRYELPLCAPLPQRPVVVGLGPAGLFAALLLAQCGQRPIVLERGLPVEERAKSVEKFWLTGVLDVESNIQFGEGGAGAFSDGKLTTGTGDGRIRKVLEELCKAGAPEEILTDARPHIGTDRLPGVVKNIRQEIIALGGQVVFGAKVTGFDLPDGKLRALTYVKDGAAHTLPCDKCILAVGHSARDVFTLLYGLGLPMAPKAFSLGVRIEHPAVLINRAQYGEFAGHPALGAADYKLSCQLPNGRGVYTFCMCPGGTVTGAASEEGGIVTNGMSTWARDADNSNAALLVGVAPDDFPSGSPLSGMHLQRQIEHAAFVAGGGGYKAPAQLVGDFLQSRATKAFASTQPTYRPGVVPADLARCLPSYVVESLRAALPILGRRLKGFDCPDAVLTAPETRSSSPVRILRGEDCQSPAARGLYPCGEGAGYAGGIVSAAVDGLRCGEALLK